MLNPKNVLEIGTFTGYATLSMAEGLAEDGKIYTLDKMKILHICLKNILMKANIMLRSSLF